MCLPISDERDVKVGGSERNLLGKSIFAGKIFRSIFMHRGYIIVDESFEAKFKRTVRDYSSLIKTGKSRYKDELNNNIKLFKDEDGYLRADVIQANWFPLIDVDVFISHSHNDQKLAIAFSQWLKDSFGISSFVDSCVWGCAYELLELINNKYNLDKRSQLYKYEECMYAASHVYMILSRALASMIDRTECLFFLSTSNSLRNQYEEEEIDGEVAETASPWIYSEIEMTRLIGKKEIGEQREQREQRRVQDGLYSDPLRVNYPIETEHLTEIGWGQLSRWEEDWRKGGNSKQKRPASEALDLLYARTK
mgnify:CR=1 FL=1